MADTDFLTCKNLAFFSLIAFGLLLVFVLHDFIAPFLGAVIFYTLFKPLMDHLTKKTGWKKRVAVLLIILLSFIIILIPILGMSYMLYAKISVVMQNPDSLIGMVSR